MATEILDSEGSELPEIALSLQEIIDAENIKNHEEIESSRADGRLIKTVDGIHIVMSDEEEAETRAGWAAWHADAPIRAAAEVRAKRNELLTATDYYATRVTEGVPIPDKIKIYRQALRDITKQPSFPDVAWPTVGDQ